MSNVVEMNLQDVYSSRFLEYGSSTVLNRAIPDVIDGLLPVRRKILFTFMKANTPKPKKATYFIGNCMSTVYVQGDASLYDSMCSMAQWFKMLNPLLTPQGSVGSPANPTPAAARYLELGLSKFGKQVFFNDYNEDIMDMKDNYDATMKEPITLPSIFPTIFNIGITGIGSGFASEIPPHRVEDICNLTIKLIDNENISEKDLYTDFAPDFPLGGIITNASEIPSIYSKGQGVFKMKATIEEGKHNGKDVLIIKDLPYRVSTEKVLLEISDLCKSDKNRVGVLHNLVANVFDDSDKNEPVRVIIVPKKNASLPLITNLLYDNTSLSTSIKYIANVLSNGKLLINAKVKDVLKDWLDYRYKYYIKKYNFEIKKLARKYVINKALIKAQANIEEIVKTIKSLNDKNEIIEYLKDTLEISRTEATYISEMKLYRLSNIEAKLLEDENKSIQLEIDNYKNIISEGKEGILQLIKVELESLAKTYKSPRKTKLEDSFLIEDERDLIETKDFYLTVSEDGYIYSKDCDNVKQFSNRGIKGVNFIDSRYKKTPKFVFRTNTHDDILIITSDGLMFKNKAHLFNVNNKPLISVNNNLANKKIVSVLPLHYTLKKEDFNNLELLLVTKQSLMKRISLSECINVRQNGLLIATINEGDEIVGCDLHHSENDFLISVITNKGRIQVNEYNQITLMKRPSKGTKRLILKGEEYVTNMTSSYNKESSSLLLVSKNGNAKYIQLNTIPERRKSSGQGGAFLAMKLASNDNLKFVEGFDIEDIDNLNVFFLSKNNTSALVPLNEVTFRKTRSSGGVKLIKEGELLSVSIKFKE